MNQYKSLDESNRRSWYNPNSILKEIGLQSEMVFADIGCGDGFFSLLAAKVVGPSGKVYAVDSNVDRIGNLKEKAAKQGLRNIYTSVGDGEETIFCRQCVDVVFYSNVLHDFYNPEKVLLNAKKMLKPSGILVNLDWKKKHMDFGPPEDIRFSEEKASNFIKNAHFKIGNVKETGPYHYMIIAYPGARATSQSHLKGSIGHCRRLVGYS